MTTWSFQLSEHSRFVRLSAGPFGSRCFRWFSPFVTFTKLPAQPRLLDLSSSSTSRVIRLLRQGHQSGSEQASPLTCFALLHFRSDPTQ